MPQVYKGRQDRKATLAPLGRREIEELQVLAELKGQRDRLGRPELLVYRDWWDRKVTPEPLV